ncbi:MAG: hypothetical protein NTZ69_15720 [Bacteroidia bacterium]|nr:hypothetical protein [Bacteroidia bacterium]
MTERRRDRETRDDLDDWDDWDDWDDRETGRSVKIIWKCENVKM